MPARAERIFKKKEQYQEFQSRLKLVQNLTVGFSFKKGTSVTWNDVLQGTHWSIRSLSLASLAVSGPKLCCRSIY